MLLAALLLMPMQTTAPSAQPGSPTDMASFAIPIEDGLQWEDPREVHRVEVTLNRTPVDPRQIRLQYWPSRWPDQRLPKDRRPGGGDVGWWELGNWYTGEWRTADTEVQSQASRFIFTFRPINEAERPDLKDFQARYRTTLKLRVLTSEPNLRVAAIAAFTDSIWQQRSARIVWKRPPRKAPRVQAFNGHIRSVQFRNGATAIEFLAADNPDPNSFDRTLITVNWSGHCCTFDPADLEAGPLVVKPLGIALLRADDGRSYTQAEGSGTGKTLYDRVKDLPEQTWQGAWAGMPPKRRPIIIPMGLDGGRQRFSQDASGAIEFRTNDGYLYARPGSDTPRLRLEEAPVRVSFGLPERPASRTLMEGTLPIVTTEWQANGVHILQESFVIPVGGWRSYATPPPPDIPTTWVARFTFTNPSATALRIALPIRMHTASHEAPLRPDGRVLRSGAFPRIVFCGQAPNEGPWEIPWQRLLEPGRTARVTIAVPYLVPTEEELRWLVGLDFDKALEDVAAYWRLREDASAQLVTPEPMLNAFYRAHAMHLLVNCEGDPAEHRRFARVGSFHYGVYGNEACMMVADLDRRGYHQEAEECLDTWFQYQSTEPLPGDFSSKEGVLYGAGGYEAGGYNQHHGWILWCIVEHYRFTRNRKWLEQAAPAIVRAADWIIRERRRTLGRNDIARGLLPAGSLEDIGDWWPWLSTNCYSWRGLDAAAWALEQLGHPHARKVRAEAEAYRRAILARFRQAMERSPVVRLRDGSAVPHIPSQPYRRGRSFGWICETLEGAIHLLITGILPPGAPEAEWILKDYEDNLFLSHQYGYTLPDFEQFWFGRGGMSMQACLLLDAEPYLYRDDVKNALRAIFNAIAVGYFPDAQMLTEHALPEMGDWRGDHYKTSDEANACGWLRSLFIREDGEDLLVGQAVPSAWLQPGNICGIERGATHFGEVSVRYVSSPHWVRCLLQGPRRNPPRRIRVRFRRTEGTAPRSVTVNGMHWMHTHADWVELPGDVGNVEIRAEY
ncbi:MAG: hypothetical protein ACP5VE_06820 [Chthonomonadales bacterium]